MFIPSLMELAIGGKNESQRDEINWVVMRSGPQLTVKQQMKLIEPFTERDIRDAILAIPAIKSPGLDAEPKTLAYIKEAFDQFSVSIGLEANKDKSQIVMGGCYQEGKLPFRYLGVPVTANRLSALDCRIQSYMGQTNMVKHQYSQALLHCMGADEKHNPSKAFTTTIYHIWEARNQLIFKEKTLDKRKLTNAVQEDVIQSTLYRAKENTRYYRYIDRLLG
ncbi:hypothetical protein Cgig2_025760 [Carnegiea gigantea]|uniref:Reverse transcriptase n=1 Tax=Carnegiea gigantea TaxID=171969 RepID=A0A9Q1Q6G7_9CARY|nr:hypothetical protein Cgig2_025760 [Carnegiea gigantea]